MRWIEVGILAEIVDRSGTVRKTAGCSIVGRFQLPVRIGRLLAIVQESAIEEPWPVLYRDNAEFRHNLDEVMRLNSLETEWFTAEQIERLIFGSDGEPGELIKINTPETQPTESGKAQSIEECISCLAADVESALKLATELPAEVAMGINKAQAYNALTDKQKTEIDRAEVIAKGNADGDLDQLKEFLSTEGFPGE